MPELNIKKDELNGGYLMLKLSDKATIYSKAKKAITANKPVLLYGDGIPHFAKTMVDDTTNKVIIVDDEFTIAENGTIEPYTPEDETEGEGE